MSDSNVINMSEQRKRTAEFHEARIKRFTTKPGKMGETLGEIVIEIESDNPEIDFEGIAALHRTLCSVLIVEGNIKLHGAGE